MSVRTGTSPFDDASRSPRAGAAARRADRAAFAEAPATVLEAVGRDDLRQLAPCWRDLESRAGQPNAFASAAFLLPALDRLAGGEALTPLLVWRDRARIRLVGLAVLRAPRLGPARLWRSEQAGLPALLCAEGAESVVLESLLAWLRLERPWSPA